jgi:2-iminoacetate synthase
MQFTPEKYRIPDIPMQQFIDSDEIWDYLNSSLSSADRVRDIVNKSLSKKRLNLEETATLINATDTASVELIKEGAIFMVTESYSLHLFMLATSVPITAYIADSGHPTKHR